MKYVTYYIVYSCSEPFFVFNFQDNYNYFVVPSGDATNKFKIKRNSKGIWGLHFRQNPRKPGRYHLAIDGQRVTAVDEQVGIEPNRKLPILHVKLIVSGNWRKRVIQRIIFIPNCIVLNVINQIKIISDSYSYILSMFIIISIVDFTRNVSFINRKGDKK